MPDKMIERVAKAIAHNFGAKAFLDYESSRNFYNGIAKVAIEAMRDYRDNMNSESETINGPIYSLDKIIDAALKE